MAAHSPELASAVGRHNVEIRHHGEASPGTRRDLAAERLAAYVRRVVAEAPPLSDEQRAKIAALLRPAP